MLLAIKGVDLIAKELQRHEYNCYRERHCWSSVPLNGNTNGCIWNWCWCTTTETCTQGLMKKDGDCLVFISTEYHVAQIVVSRECLETQSFSKLMEFDKENVVKRSATILRELVLKFIEDSPFLPLLPSIERLASDERQCPKQLKLFF